jgi:hypothetical protein
MLAAGLKPINYTLRTEDGKHLYTIEGYEYELESVTTNLRVINKPGVNAWREKLGKEEATRLKEEGGEIGTMVHKAGLRLFKGEGYGSFEWSQLGCPTPEDERVRNAVAALDLLRRERNLVPMGAECFVWSRDYGYAGTVDLAADTGEGRVDLYDWKTSGALYPEVWLQLAAYATAFTASYGIEVRRIYPVRLDRGQPTFTGPRRVHYEADEYMEWPEIADAFEAYMNAQDLGKWIREHGGRY